MVNDVLALQQHTLCDNLLKPRSVTVTVNSKRRVYNMIQPINAQHGQVDTPIDTTDTF